MPAESEYQNQKQNLYLYRHVYIVL